MASSTREQPAPVSAGNAHESHSEATAGTDSAECRPGHGAAAAGPPSPLEGAEGAATLDDSLLVSYKLDILLPFGSLITFHDIYPEDVKASVHNRPAHRCFSQLYPSPQNLEIPSSPSGGGGWTDGGTLPAPKRHELSARSRQEGLRTPCLSDGSPSERLCVE